MSRIAKKGLHLPKGVEVKLDGQQLQVKGSKGSLSYTLNKSVEVAQEDNVIYFRPAENAEDGWAQAGTTQATLLNMVKGVSEGFEKKLQLVGVGYRAQAQGAKLNLSLGFSHPVVYDVPAGITVETPSQTEIIVRGVDKHRVGQVAADIRSYRPPEPYKGKGVKYSDETILRKEAKKK
ncbi:50S ribosomal protein L6 [Thiolinea disciformis]|uniref:50S ribosomal protein L6 n=1 Tax=Thiolinea disciformis TaxID=125614 RepID=UPI00037B2D1E|nr:50S ribosomal protein L6 [Thiolinea disciformis]